MKLKESWLTDKVIFLTFLLLGFLTFGAALFNGFVGDDKSLLVDNNLAHSIVNIGTFFTGGAFNSGGAAKLAGFYYKPILLVVLSTWYGIFGPNPGVFHGLQILIHIVNSFLIFCLLKRFFNKILAFGLVMLFLVHPANVESVVYISGIQEPIFLLFGLIALLGRVYFPVNWRSNLLVGVALLMAILSKETGALFILVFVLYDFLFEKQKPLGADLKVIAVVVGIYAVLRFFLAGVWFSNHHIAPIMALGLAQRLTSLPMIILVNLQTIFLPVDLAFGQTWVVKTADLSNFWWPIGVSLGFAVVIGIIGYNLWKKGEYYSEFILFGVWGLLGIGLHLQIVPLDGTFSERWLYFPLIGIFGLLGTVIKSWLVTKKYFLVMLVTTILIMSAFIARDIVRVREWKDQFTIYLADSEKRGGSFILHNGLAQEYLVRKNYVLAEKYASRSVAAFPTFLNLNNLGVVYTRTERYEKALETLRKSLSYGPFYLTYENVVGTLLRWGKYNEAIREAEVAMQYFPGNGKLWVLWSVAKYRLGERQAALDGVNRAIQLEQTAEATYVWQSINAGSEVIFDN